MGMLPGKSEQRLINGLEPFNLRETHQCGHEVEQVTKAVDKIEIATQEQGRLPQGLTQMAHVVCDIVRETMNAIAPLLRQC